MWCSSMVRATRATGVVGSTVITGWLINSDTCMGLTSSSPPIITAAQNEGALGVAAERPFPPVVEGAPPFHTPLPRPLTARPSESGTPWQSERYGPPFAPGLRPDA